ncbi:hypothetical protein ACIRBX_30065 [Kitasatospora sp. NPDC096147]|uniref:hypothetical protein n=1 Tax=Kitasatospora sp. NPDC096147 TaxID=3364093 RepID=UPI00380DDA9B
MRKHPIDPFSLIAGLLFGTLAVLYLIASLNGREVNGRVVLPVTVLVLGGAAVIGAVTAMTRRSRALRRVRDARPQREAD